MPTSCGPTCTRVDERTAVTVGHVSDEIALGGPYLIGLDALIAAVGREPVSPVVSEDGDLTHSETKTVVEVEVFCPYTSSRA